MKKQLSIFLSLLSVSVLASCGDSISQEQAVEQVGKIKAFQESDTFAYKDDKVTFTLEISSSDGSSSVSELRMERGSYYYARTSVKTLANSLEAASDNTYLNYVFAKDGKYYSAEDAAKSKTYTELTSDDFASLISKNQKTYYTTIERMALASYSSLYNLLGTGDSGSSSALSEDSASINSSVKASYAYYSKGDGNLKVTANLSRDDSEVKATSEIMLSFDGYYPVESTQAESGTASYGSSSENYDETVKMVFNWETCVQVLPDLSQFSLKS